VQAVETALDEMVRRAERWLPGAIRDSQDYLDWLRLELEDACTPLRESNGVAVNVVGPGTLNAGISGTVYLAGLLEGDWPASSLPGILLARHQHEFAALRQHQPDAMQLAAHQLGMCLSEAQAIHLSYPKLRDDREVLRSPLIEDLTLAWPEAQWGVWPSLSAPEKAAPTSRAQLLARLGEAAPGVLPVAAGAVAGIEVAQLDALRHIRSARREATQIGIHDGNLASVGRKLVRRFYQVAGSRKLSSTSLESYARCPLRYFFHSVLSLKPPDSFQDDLQDDQRGELLHTVLERFHRAWSIPLAAQDYEPAWALLTKIAQDEIEQLALRPVLHEAELRRLIGSRGGASQGLLQAVLQAEIEQSQSDGSGAFSSALLPLGKAGHPLSGQLRDGLEVKFRFKSGREAITGRIDRIDVSPDARTIAIIDYKTQAANSLPNFSRIDGGLSFQLALYLLAARDILGEEANAVSLVAAYFSIRDAKYASGIGVEGTLGRKATQSGPSKRPNQSRAKELPPAEFAAWLNAVEQRIAQIGDLIDGGQFNLSLNSAQDAGCPYCDYRTICRQNYDLQPARRQAFAGRDDVYNPQPIHERATDDDA